MSDLETPDTKHTPSKSQGRYRAYVVHDGTNTHLGYFDTLEGAEAAAIAGRNERFTHNEVDRRTA